MLSWNIDGLLSKFEDPDFVSYVESFSFISLCETFVDRIDLSLKFKCYDFFVSPAVRLSHRGRLSGGIVCLLDRQFSEYFQSIHCDYDNVVIFRVSKTLFGIDRDVLLFCVYVPPATSPYYARRDDSSGIDMLQKCIMETLGDHGDCAIILNGDFNARTGNLNLCNGDDIFDCRADMFDTARHSADSVLNEYGKSLLALCAGLELYILNGVSDPNASGKFTFVSTVGNSVIDYYIVSEELLSLNVYMAVVESVISPHVFGAIIAKR